MTKTKENESPSWNPIVCDSIENKDGSSSVKWRVAEKKSSNGTWIILR